MRHILGTRGPVHEEYVLELGEKECQWGTEKNLQHKGQAESGSVSDQIEHEKDQ